MPNPVLGPPGSSIPTKGALIVPNIPLAVDLSSALAAINLISQALTLIVAAIPSVSGIGGSNGSQFVVTNQTTALTKVYDPNDNTIWVEVQQITALEFTNQVTGETIVWNQ